MPSTPDASPALPADSASLEDARERVVRLLTDRYADDTLTVEQFEAELDRLHNLTSVAALEQMAGELTTDARPAAVRTEGKPSTITSWATVAGLSAAYAPPSGLGWQRGSYVPARITNDEGRVIAVMSASHRAGPWAVPRSLQVWAVMSEAMIDLRDAVLPAEGCEIEVHAVMANVKVLLPPGVDTEVDVLAFMGAARDHTRSASGLRGDAPLIRVTGSSVMAEVQVFGA